MLRLTPAEASSPIRAATSVLDHYLDGDARRPLALALSGGGDSIALLIVAAQWAASRGRPIVALTVDHDLHPRSQAWTQFASDAARRLNVAWRPLVWIGAKPDTGLPAAARAARHRLLSAEVRSLGASVLLVGHTADDVAETDWMRLQAPTLGRLLPWSASPVWPEGRGVFILRPLLTVRRAALRDWLKAQATPWLDDPGNTDLRFARSRARAALAGRPLSPSPATAPLSAEIRAFADQVQVTPEGALHLQRANWPEDPLASRRLLAAAIACASGSPSPARGAALDRLIRLRQGQTPFVATLGGARVSADSQELRIAREAGELSRRPLPPTPLAAGGETVWDGRFLVRTEQAGEILPLRGSAARLSRADQLGLAPLSPATRATLPVLRVDGAIRLPRPWGHGPVDVSCLSEGRFRAACGLVAHEREISKDHMANSGQSSYVEVLALA